LEYGLPDFIRFTTPGSYFRQNSSERHDGATQTPRVGNEPEDVVMTDAQPPEYEQVVPMYDGSNMEASSFRCRNRYNRYKSYYSKNPKDMVIFIEDHLTGKAEEWYRLDEIYKQDAKPDPERLLRRIEQDFHNEQSIDDIKNIILKLRHEWGKAYEYLSEFNKLSRILDLSKEKKKLILSWQVKPSVREALYDLPWEEQNWEGYVKCLKVCDAFQNNYRIEYLEKNDSPSNRIISLMGLLDMMDPMRLSKLVDARKRRKENNSRKNYGKDKPRDNPPERYKDNNYGKRIDDSNKSKVNKDSKVSTSTNSSRRNSAWRDSRSSSNNPIPKNYAVQEAKIEEFRPLAKYERLDGTKFEEPVEILYDSGSHVNIINPELAKKIGLKVKEEPSTYMTIAGKTTLPYVTEEFKVKLWLVNRKDGTTKWHEFKTVCRLAKGVTDAMLLVC